MSTLKPGRGLIAYFRNLDFARSPYKLLSNKIYFFRKINFFSILIFNVIINLCNMCTVHSVVDTYNQFVTV